MGGLVLGLLSLVAHVTPVVHSLGATLGTVADRPLTSVVGSLGWLIVAMGLRMLFTGRLITGREADERDQRYAEKVEECKDLRSTLAAQTEGLETSNALLRAFMAKVDDDHRTAPRPPTRSRTVREDTRQGST